MELEQLLQRYAHMTQPQPSLHYRPGECVIGCEPYQGKGSSHPALHAVSIGRSVIRKLEDSGIVRGWRNQSQIRRDNVDDFLIVFPLVESVQVVQSGHSHIIQPGDITVLATSKPFEGICGSQAYSETSVRIPGALLRSRIPYIDECCALPIAGKRGAGRILRSLVDTLLDETLNQPEVSWNGQETVLMAAVECVFNEAPYLAELSQNMPALTAGEQLFAQAMQYIESHLSDPQLGPAQVARDCRISVNHLHTVFAKQGRESVAHCIRRLRVAQVRAALSNAVVAHRTITELALQWGFNSYASFSRAYHEHVGRAPSADRAAMPPNEDRTG